MLGEDTISDFGDAEAFVFDQRGFKTILNSMINKVTNRAVIYMNSKVLEIDYWNGEVKFQSKDRNKTMKADRIILTTSVGVLNAGLIKFNPELPTNKTDLLK